MYSYTYTYSYSYWGHRLYFILFVFSSFFLFSKKIPIVVVRDVCPSVRPSVCPSVRPSVCPSVRPSVCPSVRLSVRLSSVEIISFHGISISNRPIDLKIGLDVCKGAVHIRKAWFFEILIASCKFMQFAIFCK